ncbi:centriolar and ciliogenesis-associated protein HYLS1 isoform X4 [Dunckerocampus dactyliophorus]|nr:centriolar and ciliogenesis-associated protein HYLS1 isoform X4 [Dunckerocampus dactyliophorus]XP_054635337.1 centriolar and ciliogenesis-associated protein HYLS1 isoform X4 [Dunckerocampus dactyliophorus]
MDKLDFSEEEIKEQLAVLGYTNVPEDRLRQFKQDLELLIQNGSRTNASGSSSNMNVKAHEPRPPAFIKEKVSPRDFEASAGGFYLHSEHHNTQVVGGCANEGDRWTDGREHMDHEDAPPASHAAGHTLIPDTHGRHFIKRKVLRKRGGQSLVCDESIYSQDSDFSSSVQEHLSDLTLSPSTHRNITIQSGNTLDSDMEGGALSAFDSFVTHSTRARSDSNLPSKPKSFIRPIMTQQTIKKTDPVARYFQYKQLWDTFKLPGEHDHKQLRWEIRERLAYQPPAPKPRRNCIANTYVVPTEKKRTALRWEVRNNLARGATPHQFTY